MNNYIKPPTAWPLVVLSAILLFISIVFWIIIHNLHATTIVAPVPAPVSEYDLGVNSQAVRIASPRPGDLLTSPLMITGEARGWYFEGSFPVELKDGNGATLATGQAIAQSDWTTAAPVPFKAALTFAKPTTARGELVLKKDNPSGLPANDAQVSVPVQFNLNDQAWNPAPPVASCHVDGCSGQLCTDEAGIATTCEWRNEYACYKTAVCARQGNGQCGWTQTQALKDCLVKANK